VLGRAERDTDGAHDAAPLADRHADAGANGDA
jgi:hypothetical protein